MATKRGEGNSNSADFAFQEQKTSEGLNAHTIAIDNGRIRETEIEQA